MSQKLRGWKVLLFFILLNLEDLENTKEGTSLNIWFVLLLSFRMSFKLMNRLFDFLWRNQRIQKINLYFSMSHIISPSHESYHSI